MFRIIRGSRATDVRFCDGCAQVSTAEQRARRHYDRVRAVAATRLTPR